MDKIHTKKSLAKRKKRYVINPVNKATLKEKSYLFKHIVLLRLGVPY